MDKIPKKDLDNLEKFLDNSRLSEIQIVYLHGGEKIGLKDLKDVLPKILSITTKQIFLDSFKLTEDELSLIFENSTKTEKLEIVNCRIGEIGDKFKVKSSSSYKMKELNLSWTCIQDDESFLDEDKLSAFIKGLAKTKLTDSLKYIKIDVNDYDQENFEDVLEENGFEDVKIKEGGKNTQAMD